MRLYIYKVIYLLIYPWKAKIDVSRYCLLLTWVKGWNCQKQRISDMVLIYGNCQCHERIQHTQLQRFILRLMKIKCKSQDSAGRISIILRAVIHWWNDELYYANLGCFFESISAIAGTMAVLGRNPCHIPKRPTLYFLVLNITSRMTKMPPPIVYLTLTHKSWRSEMPCKMNAF